MDEGIKKVEIKKNEVENNFKDQIKSKPKEKVELEASDPNENEKKLECHEKGVVKSKIVKNAGLQNKIGIKSQEILKNL